MEAPLKKVILPNGAVDWEAFQELVTEKDFLVYGSAADARQFCRDSCNSPSALYKLAVNCEQVRAAL